MNAGKRDKNRQRLALIVNILNAHPGGLWIRELARRTGLHMETVRRLLGKNSHVFMEYADFTRYGINLKIIKLRKS